MWIYVDLAIQHYVIYLKEEKKSILSCFSSLNSLLKSSFYGGLGVWLDQVPQFTTCHKLKPVSSLTRVQYALYPHASRPWHAVCCRIQIRPLWRSINWRPRCERSTLTLGSVTDTKTAFVSVSRCCLCQNSLQIAQLINSLKFILT